MNDSFWCLLKAVFFWETVLVVIYAKIYHYIPTIYENFNDTYKEKMFYPIQYKKAAWLILTFLICLHNQLTSIHSIVTY